MARVLRLVIATSLVGLIALAVVAWRALPLTSPAEAQPAPLGESSGATLPGRDGRPCAGPMDSRPYDPSLAGAPPVAARGERCVALTGPTPVIPEAPLPILLPLTAMAALGGAVLLVRRRGQTRGEARGKEAADEE
jgi:hypothetical protein